MQFKVPTPILFVFLLAIALAGAADAKPKKSKPKVKYSPPSASMVVDLHSGRVLHEKNAYEPRYPASLTKVMTLYLLFDELRAGKLTLKSELPVSEYAAAKPPSKVGLKPGSTIAVKDAIGTLVTKSANDVAAVVAEALAGSEEEFARRMTQKARTIGMTNTTFRNASGLPDPQQRTTAHDLIVMARSVLIDHPEYAKFFSMKSYTFRGKAYRNHNSLLFSYAGMNGMKTGFTRASGFNLIATAERDDKYVLAVVLGGASSKLRNATMRGLLNASWKKALTETAARKVTLAKFALNAPKNGIVPPLPVSRQDIEPEPARVVEASLASGDTVEPVEADETDVAEEEEGEEAEVQTASASGSEEPAEEVEPEPAIAEASASAASSTASETGTSPKVAAASFGAGFPSLARRETQAPESAQDAVEPVSRAEDGAPAAEAQQGGQRAMYGGRNGSPVPIDGLPDEADNMSIHVKVIPVKPEAALFASATIAAHPEAREAAAEPAPRAVIEAAAQPEAPAPSLITAAAPAPAPEPASDPVEKEGPYQIQVGSFADRASADARRQAVAKVAAKLLDGHAYFTMQVDLPQGTMYRARYAKFEEKEAKKACATLKRRAIDCMVVRVPADASKHASR